MEREISRTSCVSVRNLKEVWRACRRVQVVQIGLKPSCLAWKRPRKLFLMVLFLWSPVLLRILGGWGQRSIDRIGVGCSSVVQPSGCFRFGIYVCVYISHIGNMGERAKSTQRISPNIIHRRICTGCRIATQPASQSPPQVNPVLDQATNYSAN